MGLQHATTVEFEDRIAVQYHPGVRFDCDAVQQRNIPARQPADPG
jgi:hypothetical protein